MAENDPRIIVALDFDRVEKAVALAKELDPALCRVKVGKELFTLAGPSILEQLHDLGHQVFLDLKFHDIPNTTAAAVSVAAELGVWMVNVHASGGEEMMSECVRRLTTRQEAGKNVPLLIGVTVLTSMDRFSMNQVGVAGEVDDQVGRLAGLAKEVGLDGVVCSAREAITLKSRLGQDFKLVTPGIRPSSAVANDQKRVVTPYQAIKDGSDYLVIGRPITAAEDPVNALEQIHQEVSSAL